MSHTAVVATTGIMIGTAVVVALGVVVVTCSSRLDVAVLAWDMSVSIVLGQTNAVVCELRIFRIVGTAIVSDKFLVMTRKVTYFLMGARHLMSRT